MEVMPTKIGIRSWEFVITLALAMNSKKTDKAKKIFDFVSFSQCKRGDARHPKTFASQSSNDWLAPNFFNFDGLLFWLKE